MSIPRFPHPLVMLIAGVFLAAALTWVIPAGHYDRRDDPVTGRSVVVAGTYRHVPAQPVNLFRAVVDIPKGMINAADVVFFVFLVGGAFTVVDKTGALRRAVDWLAERLQNRRALVIPVTCAVFALGGALENLQEEIVAMVPVLLLLCRRLGFDPLTAAAMSIGAASVGSAFSPVNPFQAVLAQKLAGLAPVSGLGYRLFFMALALALWTWGTHRYAFNAQARAESETPAPEPEEKNIPPGGSGARATVILALVGVAFTVFILGVLRWKWGFEEMAAVFFLMGLAAGGIGGLGPSGTAEAFVEGFSTMAFASLLIGFARAILVVLEDGQIIDTLVSGLFAPLAHLPVAVSAMSMVLVQAVLHPVVPSVSGQAVLTLPVLVPLSDLLHLSRQVVVLAYQYGAGTCELLIPTNGALMAILSATRVRYEDWLRFAVPLYIGLLALGLLAVLIGVVTGLH